MKSYCVLPNGSIEFEGDIKLKAAHPVNYFSGFSGKNIKNCPPSKLFLFTSLDPHPL